MARKKYDFVVIGSGLTGLICSHALVKAGKKIALVEAQEKLGGSLQKRISPNNIMEPFLNRFVTNENVEENVQRWASKLISSDNPLTKFEQTTKIYDSGKFKDFVGFGKRAPEFVDVIQNYTNTEKLEFTESLGSLVQNIIAEIETYEESDIFTSSQLTNLKIEDGRVDLAEINSTKNLEADEYIFTGSAHQLLALELEDLISTKNKQKLAKPDFWTAIHLEMLHETDEAPTENDFILMAGTDSAIPSYGYFSEPTNMRGALDKSYQQSQWISFVEANLTNDMELTGNLVREIKRQVKRAHPEHFDTKTFERISVYPLSNGLAELQLESFKQPNLENFRFMFKEGDRANNILGRIDSAIQLLDELDLEIASFNNVDKAVDKAELEIIAEEVETAEM